MHPSASSRDSPNLIVQIVDCGAYGLASYANSVVNNPGFGYRRDDPDPVKAAVEAINQVRPVSGEHEVGIPGPQVLLGRPANHPGQLVLLYMRHSHAHRLRSRRQFALILAFQLLFNDTNCRIALNHVRSIPYRLHQ